MKKILFLFTLCALITPSIPAFSDGGAVEPVHHYRRAKVSKVEVIETAPVCVAKSDNPKVKLVSWDPDQKVSKFLGELQECVTTQWDVLRLLSRPNAIGLHYPEEHEMWGYLWLWRYKLQNPMEDTVIMMDHPGKRIMSGKDPVELRLTFNRDDVLERIDLDLIKKKNSDYVLFP